MGLNTVLTNISHSKKAFFAAALLFSAIPAFYVWRSTLFPICAFLFSVVVFSSVFKHGINKNKIFVVFLFFLMSIWYIVVGRLTLFGAVLVLSPLLILFVKKCDLKQVYDAFLRLFSVLMLLSIISYVLVIVLNINLPHIVIDPLNQNKLETYYLFPFLVTTDGLLTPLEVRFFGYFDEPGMVGTLCGIILMIERFNFKKKENIVVLISGIISMSFFFYILCMLFILIQAPIKYKIIISAIIALLAFLLFENEVLNQWIFSRFMFEDGTLSGMDRDIRGFDDYFKQFRHTSAYWTGLGAGVGDNLNDGGSSYKQIIVNYGVIFFAFYVNCFFINALGVLKNRLSLFIYSVILLGTMFQRPFIGDTALSFIMFVSPYVIADNYKNKKE